MLWMANGFAMIMTQKTMIFMVILTIIWFYKQIKKRIKKKNQNQNLFFTIFFKKKLNLFRCPKLFT